MLESLPDKDTSSASEFVVVSCVVLVVFALVDVFVVSVVAIVVVVVLSVAAAVGGEVDGEAELAVAGDNDKKSIEGFGLRGSDAVVSIIQETGVVVLRSSVLPTEKGV